MKTEATHYVRICLFLCYLPYPNIGLTPPGTYNPNAHGSDACRGSNRPWTRMLDRYKSAGHPESVVSRMSGPLPETTQDRTQRAHTQSQDIYQNFQPWQEQKLGHWVGRQGLYRPHKSDGILYIVFYTLKIKTNGRGDRAALISDS